MLVIWQSLGFGLPDHQMFWAAHFLGTSASCALFIGPNVHAHMNQGLQDGPVPERLCLFTMALAGIFFVQCTRGMLLAPCFCLRKGSLSPALFLQIG